MQNNVYKTGNPPIKIINKDNTLLLALLLSLSITNTANASFTAFLKIQAAKKVELIQHYNAGKLSKETVLTQAQGYGFGDFGKELIPEEWRDFLIQPSDLTYISSISDAYDRLRLVGVAPETLPSEDDVRQATFALFLGAEGQLSRDDITVDWAVHYQGASPETKKDILHLAKLGRDIDPTRDDFLDLQTLKNSGNSLENITLDHFLAAQFLRNSEGFDPTNGDQLNATYTLIKGVSDGDERTALLSVDPKHLEAARLVVATKALDHTDQEQLEAAYDVVSHLWDQKRELEELFDYFPTPEYLYGAHALIEMDIDPIEHRGFLEAYVRF